MKLKWMKRYPLGMAHMFNNNSKSPNVCGTPQIKVDSMKKKDARLTC